MRASSEFSILRWDVWRTNRQLQAYCQPLSANLLRVVDAPCRFSGALFEMESDGPCRLLTTAIGESSRLVLAGDLRNRHAAANHRAATPLMVGTADPAADAELN